ncbi:hypothetical protein, partial [Salmonella enterica]|uniref:hypothetical protein n=1 Tax=Salmonella enterica TaxID=28901 RepID=UPI003EDC553C
PRGRDRAPAHPRAARPALGAGAGMKLWHELLAGLIVTVLALGGAYWQAERTAAFDRQDGTGEALRLVCPLH